VLLQCRQQALSFASRTLNFRCRHCRMSAAAAILPVWWRQTGHSATVPNIRGWLQPIAVKELISLSTTSPSTRRTCTLYQLTPCSRPLVVIIIFTEKCSLRLIRKERITISTSMATKIAIILVQNKITICWKYRNSFMLNSPCPLFFLLFPPLFPSYPPSMLRALPTNDENKVHHEQQIRIIN